MDGGNGTTPPDIQAILAQLSQYTPRHANVAPQPATQDVQIATPSAEISRRDGTSTPQHLARVPEHRIRPQSRTATASPKPMIDPATITTWQDGLRCVTKIAQQNAQFSASICRMMDDQRKHEMRWYSERQALKQSQVSRIEASSKVQSILQSLGGGAPSVVPQTTPTPPDKEAELAEFDRKIYVAQTQMEDAMTVELKRLGVPFFGTDVTLVVPNGYDVAKEQLPAEKPKWSVLVTESELMALRRRMVEHLEALYRD